jgi:murein L,D-transpeptidase YcbB/YkuD
VTAEVPTPARIIVHDDDQRLAAFRTFLDAPPVSGDADIAPLVTALYRTTGMQPLWTAPSGPQPRARELLALLSNAETEGLAPADYGAQALGDLVEDLAASPSPGDSHRFAADRELTAAFLRYALDLSHGRVDPDRVDWYIRRSPLAVDQVLGDALLHTDLADARTRLAPPSRQYEALRQHLRRYREVVAAGGWETVPPGAKLEIGSRDAVARLAALERRLRAGGDLDDADDSLATAARQAQESGAAAEAGYDERFAAAVRRFQRRHGIGADGIVGPATLRELNVSAEQRVRQIELNLERWRWMPRDMEPRRLVVNVPAFELSLYDGGERSAAMPVIVGRRSWPTPVFSDQLEYIVLNPWWSVPKSIARDELMPKVRGNPDFLEREGYVLTDADGNVANLEPEQLAGVSHRTHFLRQLPGPGNALGKMKFLFPNRWDVYLHDTPGRHLFSRAERTFSHGCVRVSRPAELAAFLVEGDPQWSTERIDKLLGKGPDKWLRLGSSVPIYLTYFTASVDADGGLVFHPDAYGHDERLATALNERRNRSATALVSTETDRPAKD